jgi:MFS family permease
MRSYQTLFRTPEFTPFLLSFAAFAAAQTIGGLALGTLVFRATGSPFLSALSMFGPQLAQLVGAMFLLSGADRLPPRAILTGLSLAFAAGTAVQALPGLPLWAVFGVLLAQGLVASLGGGVRGGLLTEILPKDGYVLGRSVYSMLWGLTQMAGFATGGVLLALLSPRTCLLLAAALYALSALVTRLGLTARPPRASGRPSLAATWRTNALLWSSRPRRLTYLGLWVPNGLVIGGDSLYVSYAPGAAGTLYACGALGMIAGDLLVGRLVPPAAGDPAAPAAGRPVPVLRPATGSGAVGRGRRRRLRRLRRDPGPPGTAPRPHPSRPRGPRPRPARHGHGRRPGHRRRSRGRPGPTDLPGHGDDTDGGRIDHRDPDPRGAEQPRGPPALEACRAGSCGA